MLHDIRYDNRGLGMKNKYKLQENIIEIIDFLQKYRNCFSF